MNNKQTILSVAIVLFFFSLLLRWLIVTQLHYGFEQDEIEWASIPAFKSQNQDPRAYGIWSRVISSSTLYPVSPTILRFVYLPFGSNVYSARLTLAILLSISCCVFFLVTLKFAGKWPALITTILFAYSSYRLSLGLVAEQPGFIELPYLLTILFLVLAFPKVSSRPFMFSALFLSISSCFSIITILTYNQSFYLPVLLIASTCTYLVFSSHTIRQKILLLFSVLFPYVFFSHHFFKLLKLESSAGQYALGRVAVSFQNSSVSFHLSQVMNNLETCIKIIGSGFESTTSDMIIAHSHPIVPIFVSLFAIIGLGYSILHFKRFHLLLWLFTVMFIYHGILGLTIARMWIASVTTLYFSAAVGMYAFLKISHSVTNKIPEAYSTFIKPISILSLFLVVFVIVTSELQIVFTESVHNSGFKIEFETTYNTLRKTDLSSLLVVQSDNENRDDILSLYGFALIEQHILADIRNVQNHIVSPMVYPTTGNK